MHVSYLTSDLRCMHPCLRIANSIRTPRTVTGWPLAFFTGRICSATIMNQRTNLDATIEVGPGTPDKMVSGLSIILAGYRSTSGKL